MQLLFVLHTVSEHQAKQYVNNEKQYTDFSSHSNRKGNTRQRAFERVHQVKSHGRA